MTTNTSHKLQAASCKKSKLEACRSKLAAGFTLIEIAIVLGVMGVIMAGIWLVVAVVYENVRQYQANRELQSIVQNVRQLEMRISSFSDSLGTDITATLDNQTAFPVEMRVSEATANGNLNHPWSSSGNTVHLLVEGATSFGIKFTSVPKKSCITLATKLSSGELQGLTSMEVGGTTVAIANLPINVVQAAGMCTSSNANTVKWVFNLRG